MPKTAAALLIGNELLTGKIQECNLALLAQMLFGIGIDLRRVVICPDEVETIATDIKTLRAQHDYLFTSGGIGPTHDDVTLRAVATAFERDLVVSQELDARIRQLVGERYNEGHRRMAFVPEGAELVASPEVPWPTVLIENVFVLPGLPKVFQLKLPILRERLEGGTPFQSRALYTRCFEAEMATVLDRIAGEFTGVSIGSYPVTGHAQYRVKLTVDGRDPQAIEDALRALRQALPADQIVDDVTE